MDAKHDINVTLIKNIFQICWRLPLIKIFASISVQEEKLRHNYVIRRWSSISDHLSDAYFKL